MENLISECFGLGILNIMDSMKKHIHFIGICGVAMSALALAYDKKGYKVTGSDKGFYPPVSTYLKEAGIAYYPGWHPEKMVADGIPDLVIVGNVASSTNPEWLYVQENNISYKSYPEAVADQIVKDTSIVCAGTYGKSTTTTLLAWILTQAKKDPSYMFGGISLNNIPAANFNDSNISILEGDEYKTARWDERPKFSHYSPTHLLLTSVVWDHADVYPTEQSYIDAFQSLVESLQEDGQLVLSAKVKNLIKPKNVPTVTYGKTDDNDYQYKNIQTSKDGTSFDIIHNDETYSIASQTLGDYTPDNMTGCFAMAHKLGIATDIIVEAMNSFAGVKRRLERRLDGDIAVFDDIAHSPKKAEATLRSLKEIYSGNIYAVYEPNGGNRLESSIPGYENKFVYADTVIIPRLSNIKKDPNKPTPLDGASLAKVIDKSHSDVRFIEDDEKLIELLTTQTKKGDVVAFLGSHGFRGMINELVEKLEIKNS
jgi:UDP-N-acetylmuramate: L-alanyl-gamma-D-glutamyl-meso-diaminopimelate ligase